MSVQADIAAVLQADGTLMAILTGGVYLADEVGEISRQNTPGAFDADQELRPCALISEGTELPRGPFEEAGATSVGTPVNVFFYQRHGYASIAAAMERAFPLLNGGKIGSGTWRVEYENSLKNQADQALEASLGVLRFTVVRLRA